MKIYTHKGQPPALVKGVEIPPREILLLMQTQLEIIKSMATSYMLLPSGTKLTEEEMPDDAMRKPWDKSE